MHAFTFSGPRGSIQRRWLTSRAMADSVLGDPTERMVAWHLPAGRDDGAGLPLLLNLAPWGSSALVELNWRADRETVPERLDRLYATGAMPPAVTVFADCWTRLGGHQHVDTPSAGRAAGFLCDEVIPLVEAATGAGGAGHRGAFGKSSGGFGALHLLMTRPDAVDGVAAHAADMGFDLVYRPDMVKAAVALAGDTPAAFLTRIQQMGPANGLEFNAAMILAMGAFYDPQPDQPFGLRPAFDPDSAEILDSIFSEWMRFDPIRQAPKAREALAKAKLLWFDCGDRDEYALGFGARRLDSVLQSLGIDRHFTIFSGTHRGLDARYEVSLPALARALS